jgi:ribonuclease R
MPPIGASHLPGDEGILRAALVERLRRAGRNGLGADELVSQLSAEWSEASVRSTLSTLAEDGEAVEWNRRWMPIAASDWLVGEVQALEASDAVVVTAGADVPAWSVRVADLKGARVGDAVLVRPLKKGRRRAGRLPRAAIVRRLGRSRRTAVGTLEKVPGGRRRLVPFDPRSRLDPWVAGGDDLAEDVYVLVELAERRPGLEQHAAVVEVLGSAATPGVDVEVVLRHYEIPEEFPAGLEESAAELPEDPVEADFKGRRDLRKTLTVTIDGATARDFDDAISVEETESGGWRLGVHIADVAHYVGEGGAFDLEAYRRGTSVYFPDRAVPMLPEHLSNGLCSLRPGVPRLTMSAFMTIDERGKVVRRRFAESVIRSGRRLTYEEVTRLLEEPRPGDEREYGEVLDLLRRAEALMRKLLKRRLARGSIDFDLPEGDVILDTEGFTVGVRPGQRTVAHRIIEEFMIAANETVARELDGAAEPALYRLHDPPSKEALEELRDTLAPLGLPLKGDLEAPQPSALQAVLRRVEGRPEEPFVSSLVLRSMQRAIYDPESRGHYALASRHYTHFTSPIRRYPDLVVHRRLKARLRGRPAEEAQMEDTKLLAQRLPAIAGHCSTTERRAERAERDLLQWKLVRLLADRVGERFDGRISGVQPFGMFVMLANYFVDGLVAIRTLADDYYVYDPAAHTLEGSDKERVFRLADEVEVVLAGVSQRHRGLDLRIAGMPEPPERSRRGRRPGGRDERGRPSRRRRGSRRSR